jgi:site-specific DNA recombinase
MTRALGVIRLSKSPDPASTSLARQRKIIEQFCDQQGYTLAGFAEDVAKSAFHVPPEKRKAIAAWLERPDDFDCIVYWRQDRLVRRAMDFMGLVQWCQLHGKALYSATEGMGDVTQSAGILLGFIKAWQSEGESASTSVRVSASRKELAEQGRYPGGRPPYGFKAVKNTQGAGWVLVPDADGTARIVAEAAHRAISGEAPNAIIADFNRRGIKAADGGVWKAVVLRKILRNPALMSGILTSAEFGQLQLALDERKRNRNVRTLGRDSMLLDLVYCGKCGGKLYRWHRKRQDRFYGRCRNELKRSEVETPCDMPMVPYEVLESAVTQDIISEHGTDVIETRVTDATRQARIDAIDRELIGLAGKLASKQVDRSAFTTRQAELLDERDELEQADSEPRWETAGETVAQRWERLSDAERRLWLLRIGTTYSANRETKREDGRTYARWAVMSSWRAVDDPARRERVVRA